MKIKSSSNLNSTKKNSVNNNKNTVSGTCNYVSGGPAPSSANHKFQNTEGSVSKDNPFKGENK
ncbi:MAG: hypothetical protein WCD89_08690 [Anaerocolumna sp.]